MNIATLGLAGTMLTGMCLSGLGQEPAATPTSVADPDGIQSFLTAFGRTQNDYARSLNFRRRESGHLWQSRFHACPVQSCYLGAVLAYVESSEIW